MEIIAKSKQRTEIQKLIRVFIIIILGREGKMLRKQAKMMFS